MRRLHITRRHHASPTLEKSATTTGRTAANKLKIKLNYHHAEAPHRAHLSLITLLPGRSQRYTCLVAASSSWSFDEPLRALSSLLPAADIQPRWQPGPQSRVSRAAEVNTVSREKSRGVDEVATVPAVTPLAEPAPHA